jgi:PhnB protein
MSVNVPKDPARGKQVFDSLAEGGKVTMPFAKQFWGAQFGMLVDKFGVPWMVNSNE